MAGLWKEEDPIEFDPDALNEAFKEFSIKLNEAGSLTTCSDCQIMMEYQPQNFAYVCPQCCLSWRVEGAGSITETMVDDNNHAINISNRGNVFHLYANNVADARIRKKLDTLNRNLKTPIHPDIIEKIFTYFLEHKSLNRGKKDSGMLAYAAIKVCQENGVRIPEEEIKRAFGVDSDIYNSAKKTTRNLQVSTGLANESPPNKLLQEIQVYMNELDIDEKFEPLLLLYVQIHQKMADSSAMLKSRIAGAIWYLICRAKLPISEKVIEEKTKVSANTFKANVAKELEKIFATARPLIN